LIDADGLGHVVDLNDGSVRTTIPGPLVDVAVADVDGDGMADLLVCGPDGLSAVAWASHPSATIEMDDVPCFGVVVVEADRTLAVALLGDQLHRYALGGGGPIKQDAFGQAIPPTARLKAEGDTLAVLRQDGLDLWGPDGQQIVRTELPVDSAARSERGWVWTTGGVLGGATSGDWFPDARGVVTQDLDADGRRTPAVLHPASRLVGWQDQASERAEALPFRPRMLAQADVNGDGGEDLVLLGDAALTVILAAGPPPIEQRMERAFAPAPTRSLLGVPVPLFQDTHGTLASGRRPPERAVTGGMGIAAGSALGGGQGLGASPIGVVAIEGMERQITPWVGFDTAPFFVQLPADGFVFWHLAMVSAGASIGNPHLRTGPYASLGILGAGVGLRTLWTPFETRSGLIHGLEGRMTTFADAGGDVLEPVGQVSISYVSSIPMGGKRAFDQRLPGVLPTAANVRSSKPGVCRRFGFSLGAVGGGSQTTLSWDFVGSRFPFEIAATPAASAYCESGSENHGLLVSLDSAPWYRYRIPWGRGLGDTRVAQMGTATLGYALGNDWVRVGPIGTAGIWALGGGARIVLTPLAIKAAGRHGVEARGLLLWPSVGSWEGGIFYTFWMDPRR
jgi:hypothetical protein